MYESEVPVIVIDYMWMTGEEEKGTKQEEFRGMPILTAVDDSTEWMGAWVVPEKRRTLVRHQSADYVHRRVGVQEDHPEERPGSCYYESEKQQ
jgi:hypothetical protein